MDPIDFPESNMVFAKDQPEYLPLPAYKNHDDPEGKVISCWKMTWKERFRAVLTGKMWFVVLTFHQPLQPQRPGIDSPFRIKEENDGV